MSGYNSNNIDASLDIKLLDCISKRKLLVENIIGYTEYSWKYSISKFVGICLKPVEFTPFDEVICKILSINPASLAQLGEILGLDVDDIAEKELLLSAIKDLKNDQMIETDGVRYQLTAFGEYYTKNGFKFTTYEKEFELYVDLSTKYKGDCRRLFEHNKSQKIDQFPETDVENIEIVRSLAEIQLPNIQSPSNCRIIQSCQHINTEGYEILQRVVLLENFVDNTIRILVYDEDRDCINDELSEIINKNDTCKQSIIKKIVDTTPEINHTEEKKNSEQINIENSLLYAFKKNKQSYNQEVGCRGICSKHLFGSVEFRAELHRLIENSNSDLWFVSPLMNKSTLRRMAVLEKHINKGGRIFLAYSNAESKEIIEKLHEFETQHPRFYMQQLNMLQHELVWTKGDAEDKFYIEYPKIYLFNVNKKRIRLCDKAMFESEFDSNQIYTSNIIKSYAMAYVEKKQKQFDLYSNDKNINRRLLSKISLLKNNQLSIFADYVNHQFKDKCEKLEKQINDLYIELEKKVFNKEFVELQNVLKYYDKEKNITSEIIEDVQDRFDFLKNNPYYEKEKNYDIRNKIRCMRTKYEMSSYLNSKRGI